jgi:hypothetical protein
MEIATIPLENCARIKRAACKEWSCRPVARLLVHSIDSGYRVAMVEAFASVNRERRRPH